MSGPTTALVADDQPRVREQLASLLRDAGYRVVLAEDGDEALRACRRTPPDVAVLDVIMPATDGIEVCKALRADDTLPYIPVVFVSSRGDPAERARGLRAGADDYVGKPFDDDELLARVEAVVRVGQLIRRAESSQRFLASDQIGRDRLTGVWNAAYLDDRLGAELERAARHNEPLTLVVIDIECVDDLDAAALRATAAAIAECTRSMDIIARAPGVAFAVILPNTHFADAIARADRMWRALAGLHLGPQRSLRASMGVACFPNREVKTSAQLLAFAKSALDRALAEGPAHICLFQHQAYIFQPE